MSDFALAQKTVSGTVDGNRMSLTIVERHNILISGTDTISGVIELTSSATLNR